MDKPTAKHEVWKAVADLVALLSNAGWPFNYWPAFRQLTNANHARVEQALVEVIGFCVRKGRGEL